MSSPGWFGVIDGARSPELYPLISACAHHACLFLGPHDPALAPNLPWLVALTGQPPLARAWHSQGMGQSWGIMCESDLPLEDVLRRLRRFTMARLPAGDVVLFRFYDPRVFRVFIEAASPAELAPWFKDISRYAAEDDAGVLHYYRLAGGVLLKDDQPLAVPA